MASEAASHRHPLPLRPAHRCSSDDSENDIDGLDLSDGHYPGDCKTNRGSAEPLFTRVFEKYRDDGYDGGSDEKDEDEISGDGSSGVDDDDDDDDGEINDGTDGNGR